MAVVQLPFSNSLSRISTSHGRVIQSAVQVDPMVEDASMIATKATLGAIGNRFRSLEQQVHHELSLVHSKITAVAMKVAKEALGSESELIEERVAHFAGILLQQLLPTNRTVIYVNASCMETIASLVSESDRVDLIIQSDPSIEPGDCRIETDGKGFLASLDSYLDAAATQNDSARGRI